MAKKILLVDDDRDLVQNYEKVFKAEGYDLSKAYSARDGLRTALSVRPDLIILDVSMETDVAGFEFFNQLRSARENSRYKDIRKVPVIFLTAINQVTHSRFSLDDDHSFLRDVGGVFTKPVKLEALLAKVKQLA